KGIVERWGYRVEQHDVTISDGYILDLFRLPAGRNDSSRASNDTRIRPTILFVHGLQANSLQYVLNLPNQSAGISKPNVFLANTRGKKFGKRHVQLNSAQNEFSVIIGSSRFSFRIDEMANFDVPATIDKVLELNGNEHYIVCCVHGTVLGFTALADNPEYNGKVKKMFALTPVGSAHYLKGLFRFLLFLHDSFRPITH
ncbi:hypothetical protein PRIPAC_81795, partial [Pristionchus pacificus]|uniref:Abhydro_lipase domain-containing protein n=1 Tax=Pristionchus pacificus TaxID=54126 RepID=A0A2A6CJ07_PRIPA